MNKEVPRIFDVPLEGGTFSDVWSAFERADAHPFWIVTANPEILLDAQEDPSYAEVLRLADWRTIDGFGIQLILKLKGNEAVRLTGVDLAEQLLIEAEKAGWMVGFFGGFDGGAQAAADVWMKRLPALKIVTWSGGTVLADGSEDERTRLDREGMQASSPDVVFVALGGGKKQERWIARHVKGFSGTKLVVGIGGAFDMWSGRLRRAPAWVRGLGLEWGWRLWLEPRRWKRIWRAVAVFPFRALKG